MSYTYWMLGDFERAVAHWRSLVTDPGAKDVRVEVVNAAELVPDMLARGIRPVALTVQTSAHFPAVSDPTLLSQPSTFALLSVPATIASIAFSPTLRIPARA